MSAELDQGESGRVKTVVRHDVARTTLAVLFMVGLLAGSFWILRPFLFALVWGTMIVVATWPVMLRMQAALWQRRWLAVTAMTAVLLLAVVIPFSLALGTIIGNVEEIADWVQSIGNARLPQPPHWLHRLPLVGEKASTAWEEFASKGPEDIAHALTPYARNAARWFVAQAGGFGAILLHFLLTVLIAAILFAHGETAAAGVRRFCRRLAGARGEGVVELAGQAIRAVALGVVVTALVDGVLGGIGLAAAGVPFAAILTALIFIFAVAQIGPAPILIGAIAWLYWKEDGGWATALLVWTLLVVAVDHVLRPILIQKSGPLPLLLIFAGVIGGLMAFGAVGIFVGPVVLAVTYRLLGSWMREADA